MTVSHPTILVAMPLFDGWEHVVQTLESVKSQTYEHYRVLISVDGDDRQSYEVCEPYAEDPRFQLVLHETRLGWAGNINWLAGQLREDYFCYWQHDDYCDPDYLKILIDHAEMHPEASSIYCDMQHFGTRNNVVRQPSNTGSALERVLKQAEHNNPAVIRCLIRADAMRSALPVTSASTWALAVARAGELHRIPRILYFRRNRPESLGMKMLSMPENELLEFTMEWGLGLAKHAGPLMQREEIGPLLATIADKMVHRQARGRWQFDFAAADPTIRKRFAADFIARAAQQFDLSPCDVEDAKERLNALELIHFSPKPRNERPKDHAYGSNSRILARAIGALHSALSKGSHRTR